MGYREDAEFALTVTTSLTPHKAVVLVRRIAGEVRPPAVSLTLGRLEVAAGQRINVDSGTDRELALSIVNVKVVRFCTFRAVARERDGVTQLSVGPLESFKTSQDVVMFIPTGPKRVVGFSFYKHFLETVAREFEAADPNAQCSIAQGGSGATATVPRRPEAPVGKARTGQDPVVVTESAYLSAAVPPPPAVMPPPPLISAPSASRSGKAVKATAAAESRPAGFDRPQMSMEDATDPAVDLLRARLAKGEIDVAAYRELLAAALDEASAP